MNITGNKKAALFIFLILGCLCSSAIQAEPIEGQITDVIIAGNGKYIIASYTGPYIVVWDTDRLWEYHQPIQVLAFKGSGTNAIPIAASRDGKWLASKNSGSPMVAVCKMEVGFPCHFRIPVEDRYCGLQLSPNGRQLLIITQNEIQLVDLLKTGIIHDRKKQPIKSAGYIAVDWKHGLLATKVDEDSIIILNLKNFEVINSLNIAADFLSQIVFSGDGRHLIVCHEYWYKDKDFLERSVQVYYFLAESSQANHPVGLKSAEYVVPGDSEGEYWCVENSMANERKLSLLNPSAEKTNRSITISVDDESEIIAVSEHRGYILVKRDDVLYTWDLRTRLPMFQLHDSKVKYQTSDGYLPHLVPRLGAAPVFEMLEKLSFASGFEQTRNRKHTLFWLASLVTRLRTRYDRVWFSLLTELRDDENIGRGLLLLNELIEVLIQLNKAEFLLNSEQPEEALRITEKGLRLIRSYKKGIGVIPRLYIHDQDIRTLVANYWPVLEREFLLVQGLSATSLNKIKKAEYAYRMALKIESQEWRAYSGLLSLHLISDSTTFHSILAEAQKTLQMKGWKSRSYLGYPDQFFDEKALAGMRAGIIIQKDDYQK